MQLGDVGPDLVLGRCVMAACALRAMRACIPPVPPLLPRQTHSLAPFVSLSLFSRRAKRRRGNGPANLLNPSYRGEDPAKR